MWQMWQRWGDKPQLIRFPTSYFSPYVTPLIFFHRSFNGILHDDRQTNHPSLGDIYLLCDNPPRSIIECSAVNVDKVQTSGVAPTQTRLITSLQRTRTDHPSSSRSTNSVCKAISDPMDAVLVCQFENMSLATRTSAAVLFLGDGLAVCKSGTLDSPKPSIQSVNVR